MQNNFAVLDENLTTFQGFTLGALSGLMTVVAADADVFGMVNLNATPCAINQIRVRFATTTAFAAAQSMILSVAKVYGFTAIHTTGGTAIQAHYSHQQSVTKTRAGVAVTTGDRIPAVEIAGYVVDTTAITGATYTAADADEPELVAVGAGSTLPGVYEDFCRYDGLPILVLPQNTGIVCKVRLTMGTSGVGRLFVGVDGYRMLT